MYRIVFVCLGNICRSPMAELLLRDKLRRAGKEADFEVISRATSDEEEGNGVYPPVARLLRSKGIDPDNKRARQLTREEGDAYDLFVCMDDSNMRNCKRILGEKNAHKCRKLNSFVGSDSDIADPWYTRDFEGCYAEINRATDALIKELVDN